MDKLTGKQDGTITAISAAIDITTPDYKKTAVWRNLCRRARRNGYPLLKQALVDAIKAYAPHYREAIKAGNPVLTVQLEPCGGSAEYATFDDIPETTVMCPCGDKSHYLLRYIDNK